MHFRRYRLGDLTTKAREAGFAILKATHLGFFVYPLFKMVKRRNQKTGKNLSYEEKKDLVARQIGRTAGRLALGSCQWWSDSSELLVRWCAILSAAGWFSDFRKPFKAPLGEAFFCFIGDSPVPHPFLRLSFDAPLLRWNCAPGSI
jgi:hypothetical protein